MLLIVLYTYVENIQFVRLTFLVIIISSARLWHGFALKALPLGLLFIVSNDT